MSAAEESSQIRSGLTDQLPDKDPQETSEWIESLDGLIEERGTERAQYIMRSLMQRASAQSVALPYVTTTDYVNTIPADQEPEYPGDEELERRYRNYLRWNAMALVQRAHRRHQRPAGAAERRVELCLESQQCRFANALWIHNFAKFMLRLIEKRVQEIRLREEKVVFERT